MPLLAQPGIHISLCRRSALDVEFAMRYVSFRPYIINRVKMGIKLEVNGRTIERRKGETILSALNRHGMHVPTICSIKDLSPSGACRMCVVEVEGRENLVPACSFPIEGQMKITDPFAKGTAGPEDQCGTASCPTIPTIAFIVSVMVPANCSLCQRT